MISYLNKLKFNKMKILKLFVIFENFIYIIENSKNPKNLETVETIFEQNLKNQIFLQVIVNLHTRVAYCGLSMVCLPNKGWRSWRSDVTNMNTTTGKRRTHSLQLRGLFELPLRGNSNKHNSLSHTLQLAR